MKMEFSASSTAWVWTCPNTVLRRMLNTENAHSFSGAPTATASSLVASTMLSLM